jgi:hypothetical protein
MWSLRVRDVRLVSRGLFVGRGFAHMGVVVVCGVSGDSRIRNPSL